MTGRERIGYSIKTALAFALYHTGVLKLWQSVVLRRKAVVLMYHRVLTPAQRAVTASHPGIIVDEPTFAAQMRFLRRHFRVVSLDELRDRLERGIPFEDSSCLITFDDGWKDNYDNGLPHLVRNGLPAVVFLPVDYIGGSRSFWPEALTHLLFRSVERVRRNPVKRDRLNELLAPVGLSEVLSDDGGQGRQSVFGLVRRLKEVDPAGVEWLIAQLAAELEVDLAAFNVTDGFLTWEQVDEMSRRGIAFGGHGVRHRILTRLGADDAEAEVRASKELLEANLRRTPEAFAYPNGDWSESLASAVERSGYSLAFTTRRGFVGCTDGRFTLPRVNIHQDMTHSMPMFLARITGLL